jgi:small subunit ribosomal protein S1
LSEERVEKPEDVAKVGDEMDFRILRVEQENRKIGLSARAAKSDEPVSYDAKSYSTEAKGGMASLAELANLGFGTSAASSSSSSGADKGAGGGGAKSQEAAGEEPKAQDAQAAGADADEMAAGEPRAEVAQVEQPQADEPQAEAPTPEGGDGAS